MALVSANSKQNVDIPRFLPVLKTPGVPRMRADSTSMSSTRKELYEWNRMYQNRFFNPDQRIVTGKDVCEILSYQPIPVSPFNCLTPCAQHQRNTKLRPRHCSIINQKTHVYKTSRDLIAIIGPCPEIEKLPNSEQTISERMKSPLLLPRLESPELKSQLCISNTSIESGSCESFNSDEENRELQKLKGGPETNREFRLRAPRLPVLPSAREGEKLCGINGPLVESWCPWNYVTFQDNAPFTPQSFYVQNYALLLSRIPKRSEDDDEADLSAWRPLRATPDVDLTFFDNLPSSSLSWHSLSSSEDEQSSHHDINYDTHSEK